MDLTSTLPIVGGIIAVLIILIVFITGYVKASPDTAYIISGLRKKPKILIGKAGIKIPFFEKKDEVTLKLIPVDINLETSVPTADFINIKVDAIVNVKVDVAKIELAAQHFLNRDTDYIASVAQSVLEGNTREIVGKMELKQMVNDREKFADEVTGNAVPTLAAMGLTIVSYNVQNFSDNDNVITNLGIDNISKISKDAAIAKTNSQKEVAIAEAEADIEANQKRVEADSIIAERNNELEIKKSKLKKEADIKRAEADAAYQIQSEEQRKTVEINKAQANIAKEEQEIILKQRAAEVQEQELSATIKKQADADKYQAMQKADADKYKAEKDAEADLIKTQKEAEAKKYAKLQEAEGIEAVGKANAAAIKATGEAEADAIKAKALAEAEGIERKAEAMQKMNSAAVLEMYFDMFPEAVKNAAVPLSNVDNITMYGNGNNEQLVGSVMNTVKQVDDGIKASTGLDIKSILAGFVGANALTNGIKNSVAPTITENKDDATIESDTFINNSDSINNESEEK